MASASAQESSSEPTNLEPRLNTNEPVGDPPMICYTDASGILREIFLPEGTYRKALSLLEAEDWDALSQFPRWSDQPALGPMQADMMSYIDPRTEERREIFLPLGKAERAGELLMVENWAALESEFEPYKGQIREDAEIIAEHERGVQRCRREREEKANVAEEKPITK